MVSLNEILSNPDGLYSIKDICSIFKVSDSAVWNWVNFNKIDCTKVGNTWVFTGKNIRDYLDRQQIKSRGGFNSVANVLANREIPHDK